MAKITRVLTSKPFVLTLWFGLCLFPVIKSVIEGHSHIHNNYFVYKGNFLALILTSLSPSDMFPRYIKRTYAAPYSSKVLPCFLTWVKIIYETLLRNFTKKDLNLPSQTV